MTSNDAKGNSVVVSSTELKISWPQSWRNKSGRTGEALHFATHLGYLIRTDIPASCFARAGGLGGAVERGCGEFYYLIIVEKKQADHHITAEEASVSKSE